MNTGTDRLIDLIFREIHDKDILNEIEYVCFTEKSFKQLMEDFREEFVVEYEELGRDPSKEDVQDYLNLPILIIDFKDDEGEFKLLRKI